MKQLKVRGQLIPLFLILPILVLLLVGSLMIHRFYRNLGDRAIEDEKRRLDSIVYRTYFRETQRITLILQALKQLPSDEPSLRQSLRTLVDLYGSDTQEGGLIHKIGYSESENPGILLFLDDSGDWQSAQGDIFPDGTGLSNPPPGGTDFFVKEKGITELIEVVFLHTPFNQERFTAVLELDWFSFEKLYIEPALEEQLENYDLLQGREDIPLQDRIGPPPLHKVDYPFHPIQSLLGWNHSENIDHIVFLPDPFQTKRPDRLEGDPNQLSALFTEEIDLEQSRYVEDRNIRFLRIGLKNNPFYLSIEKQFAMHWIQSMIILVGIALIFLLAMFQLMRLSMIRNREKEFVASMTHELRTPLTVIQSASDNLSEGIVAPERAVKYGELIMDQVKRLSRMIEEILQFSSMEGQPQGQEQVKLDGREIAADTVESVKPLAEKQGITLSLDTASGELKCYGDPDLLRLGINNLLMNSLLHAYGKEEGTIRVKIKTGIPGSLVVTVEDEGRGIPPNEQKKVLTPFYRGRFSRQNQEKGSGLGLFILSRKLQVAGGSLELESPYRTPDGSRQQGCRFTMNLPCSFTDTEEDIHND